MDSFDTIAATLPLAQRSSQTWLILITVGASAEVYVLWCEYAQYFRWVCTLLVYFVFLI